MNIYCAVFLCLLRIYVILCNLILLTAHDVHAKRKCAGIASRVCKWTGESAKREEEKVLAGRKMLIAICHWTECVCVCEWMSIVAEYTMVPANECVVREHGCNYVANRSTYRLVSDVEWMWPSIGDKDDAADDDDNTSGKRKIACKHVMCEFSGTNLNINAFKW